MNTGLAYLSRHQRFRSVRPPRKGDPWRVTLTPELVTALVCRAGSVHNRFYLGADASVVFEEDRRPGHEGGVKVKVIKYIYTLQADEDPASELISWHWHPAVDPVRPDPHVHVRLDHDELPGLRDMHLPSGRVMLEDVLYYAVRDLDVGAKEGTEELLRLQIQKTRRYATW